MLKSVYPVGDGPGHQGKSLRHGHPRRETNPQSHGTPPESAGPPKTSHPSRPRRKAWGIRNVVRTARHTGRTSMSNRFDLRRARLAAVALAVTFSFAAVPVASQASAVDLGTVSPFVVLGGSTVTNEGTSVLNG